MEEKINKDSFRAAFIAGISTFIGFSIIFPLMAMSGLSDLKDFKSILATCIILFGYFLLCGTAVIGLLEAALLGLVVYFVFKFLIPDKLTKKQLKVAMILISLSCAIIGLLSLSFADQFIRESNFGKERVWTVDTNNDGKPNKWVHDDIYDKTIEIDYDTNLDGKPDVWEYYKNGKIYKKIIDTNFDGKSNKIENY